jgi:hypothetical protein
MGLSTPRTARWLEAEGRSGSRIDFRAGGRYLDIPYNAAFHRPPPRRLSPSAPRPSSRPILDWAEHGQASRTTDTSKTP